MLEGCAGWTLVTGDLLITEQPALLHGIAIDASVLGGTATVYDGTDATSGRKVGDFKGAANITRNVHFNPPLLCLNGLYVTLDTNVDEALIVWTPLPE